MDGTERIQLHLVLPYKHEVRDHPRIRSRLEDGYRIVQLQRVTDREVLVTLRRTAAEES
jgi:hypothetical protein